MTSANMHEGRLEQALSQGNEEGYFADKAATAERFATRSRAVRDHGSRASRGDPLETWQISVNAWDLGHSLGRRAGLARNHCHLQFVATAMNMKRALILTRQGVKPTDRRGASK
jgi:transposase, IS5 family